MAMHQALNPMIKVVNLVSLIAAPVIVRYQLDWGESFGGTDWIVIGIIAVFVWAFIWAFRQSKKTVIIAK